jgi:hypothetical protein
MRRPWYVGTDEWVLRGGWERERDLICRSRLRLFGLCAVALTVLMVLIGTMENPPPLGGSVLYRGK